MYTNAQDGPQVVSYGVGWDAELDEVTQDLAGTRRVSRRPRRWTLRLLEGATLSTLPAELQQVLDRWVAAELASDAATLGAVLHPQFLFAGPFGYLLDREQCVDCDEDGDDESIIMQREGGWARIARVRSKLSTMETTGHIVRIKNQLNDEPGLMDWVTMALDADGLGAGVYDRLVELGHSVGEIRGGMPSLEPDDFFNARSEWCWKLRERFECGDIDIDPNDKELAKQLGKIKLSMTSKGQIKVESKDEMRKRGLSSPDRADALAYAFANIDIPAINVEQQAGHSITGDLMQKAWCRHPASAHCSGEPPRSAVCPVTSEGESLDRYWSFPLL
jgi:hypothetical protein